MNIISIHFSEKRKIMMIVAVMLLFIAGVSLSYSQATRIHYAGREIFLSGINIAWVNFAGDIGPNAPDLTQFQTEFQTVHGYGGNVMRFWLHTNGTSTPVFDGNGYVTGPGPVAIQNLRQILDLAWQNNIGLILCLWSHDMLNQAQLDTAKLHRNAKLLTDTSYTNAYIRTALIPMVDSLKGHPAIVAWEIFNEPEGITDEFGWTGRDHVPMAAIRQFTNLTVGAIHRTDTTVLVTTGAHTFQHITDVNTSPSIKNGELNKINSLPMVQKKDMADQFNAQHRLNLTVEEYFSYINNMAALTNYNQYRDDRLIAAGGDSDGTLDFYCAHYYAQGTSISPFVHTASYWGLTKPIVPAEFYTQATDGVPGLGLYPWLFQNGYAGGMAWSWTDFGNPVTNSRKDTWTSLQYIFDNYRNDVIINPKTGSIYKFTISQNTIEKTDSAQLKWDVEPGSVVKLDGSSVSVNDSLFVTPLTTTTYTLTTTGQVSDTDKITVSVLPTGRILEYRASPSQIGTGENTWLMWHVVKGSSVTLNGNAVPVIDTLEVFPQASANTYTLMAHGDENDSTTITVQIFAPDQVNRAYGAPVAASSNDTVTYSFSKPQNIVDGNNITRWQAAAIPVAQSVQVDLGRVDSIKKIIIRWGNKAYAKQYSVQASPDLVGWSVLKSVLSGTGGTNFVETLDNLSGIGRYLTFLLQSQGSGAYSIAEIYVYGVPATTTGVEMDGRKIPVEYSLSQNYPNPFNPATTINFDLPKNSGVKLQVFNLLGQKVATLVNSPMEAGRQSVVMNAGNLSSGIYFYRLEAGEFVSIKKMLLLK